MTVNTNLKNSPHTGWFKVLTSAFTSLRKNLQLTIKSEGGSDGGCYLTEQPVDALEGNQVFTKE